MPDELSTPAAAPHIPEAQGTTQEELAKEASREFAPSSRETIPESVTAGQILEENRKRWTQKEAE
jgi:hypothetical protein